MPPRKSFINGKYALFTAGLLVDFNTGRTITAIRNRTPTTYLEQGFQGNTNKLTRDSEELKQDEYELMDGSGHFFSATETQQVNRDAPSDFSVFAKMEARRKINSAIEIHGIDGAQQLITHAPIETLKKICQNWVGA